MLEILLSNKILALFIVITSGLLIGRIQVAGLSLGSSGVIFTALALGYLGSRLPEGIGTLGLVVFVYCVGLNAGPGFFRVFVSQGKTLAVLGTAIVVMATLVAWGIAAITQAPVDLTAGIFGGAMTSTPALAAAMESLPKGSQVAVGFGIAYPFGVIGIVLFVQLLPRILGQDLNTLSQELGRQEEGGYVITRALVEVVNPGVAGKMLEDVEFIAEANCWIPRVLQGNRLVPVSLEFTFQIGQHVLVVGPKSRIPTIITLLGKRSEKTDYSMDLENERRQIVVTKNVVGRTVRDVKPLRNFGVTVSRITRHGVEFVPTPSDEIEFGDALNVVGDPHHLERFATFAGHQAKTVDETDLISLGIGLILGSVLGMISFDLGGSRFSLGMTGGPLFVALILGHFGRIGAIVGHVPRAALMLMMEGGLVLFLADAGVDAGSTLVPVVRQYGTILCLAAVSVAIVPMSLGYLVGRLLLGMNLLQLLGGLCGGMTSTPGLGVITSKTDSSIPVVSYAAAYPVALILMTVFAQVLIWMLS